MAADTMEPRTENPATESASGRPAGRPLRELGPLVAESLYTPWWRTLRDSLGESKRLRALPPVPEFRPAQPGELSYTPIESGTLREPWWNNLKRFKRTTEAERKLPPLELTSKPVAVKSIWGDDGRKQTVWISLAIHVLIVGAVFGLRPSAPEAKLGSVTLIIPVDISPYLAQLRNQAARDSGGGGGGGQNMPTPPSQGKLPRFELEQQITPPTPVIRNPDPILEVEPTVVIDPNTQIAQLDTNVFGDPLRGVNMPSAGSGQGGGIGTGTGGGVGSGRGGGVGPGSGGGIGGGVFRVGGGVSAPRLTRKVEPEYSEEARKAKYSGVVVLAVEVWPDGRAHNVRVVRSLGLGLDEKAIQAVQQWEFVPGRKDGAPVKVSAQIEVNFRLL